MPGVRQRQRITRPPEEQAYASPDRVELLCRDEGNSIETVDRRLDLLETAYLEGVRDTGELARRAGVSKVALRRNYEPALEARLARRADPAKRRAAMTLAMSRVEGLLRETWTALLGDAKPGVKVQLGQIIHSCHADLERLNGIVERDDEHQRLLGAICGLLTATTALVESTNDRELLQRFEGILERFTANGARRSGGTVDGE